MKPPSEYTGRDRYVDWIEDYLGVNLTATQREIIYTIQANQRTLVVGGNGFGKSYLLACFSLAFLYTNYPTSILATSGTYGKLRRTYGNPIEDLHTDIEHILPGRFLQRPPRIEMPDDPEVFLEMAAPQDAGELEGVHNEYTLAIIEEADKDRVGKEIFDSLESLLTDSNDKLVVVANPPKDETNIVYDVMEADGWAVLQYSSFDAQNVQVEMNHPDPYVRNDDGTVVIDDVLDYPKLKGEVQEQMIPEMTRLSQIKQDWEAWTSEPWPVSEGGGWQGAARVAQQSHERDDLPTQWYRRRLGVMPAQAADVLRPFTVEDVREAWEREPPEQIGNPDGLAWDVARGSGEAADANALSGVWDNDIHILKRWKVGDHIENKRIVRRQIDEDNYRCPFAIDTVGVGDESADRVGEWYPSVERFNAQGNAYEEQAYANKWTEGLCTLGEYLRDGASIENRRLHEELMACARTVELEERYSRKTDTDRFKATAKTAVEDRLNRSPDNLDAAYMAVLMAEGKVTSASRTIPGSF
jgi:energy-coupling factor transporter ATP-binding protein EcfA2